ncbi:MAG: dTMP kinase [Acidaminococcaceae bacterium]|jgi:dTMP kinase|nr:dTMP kinase [Acidaminococcaceae bacterium]
MTKGLFITFEGPDGSGKTTQIHKVAEWFKNKGYEVVLTREPGGTKAAEAIRQIVLEPKFPIKAECETLLYLAARAEHVEKVIAPAVAQGKVVLCDRFSDSTFVYQGLTRGVDMDVLKTMNAFATKGLIPDKTILLDGDSKQLAVRRSTRGVEDRFEMEGLAFQEKVRHGFLTLAKLEPKRIVVLDAIRDQDTVAADIFKHLEPLL